MYHALHIKLYYSSFLYFFSLVRNKNRQRPQLKQQNVIKNMCEYCDLLEL